MREVLKRLWLSICLIWIILFLVLIGCSMTGIYFLANKDFSQFIKNNAEILILYWITMGIILILCCIVSYWIAKACLEDYCIFYENKIRFRGFFYSFEEIKRIKIIRFFFVIKIKVFIENQKTAIIYKKNKSEAKQFVEEMHLFPKLK